MIGVGSETGALISTSGSGPGGTTGFISTGGLISTGSGPGGTTGFISRGIISTGGLISTGAGEEDVPLQRASEDFADFGGEGLGRVTSKTRQKKIFAPKAESFRKKATTIGATRGVSADTANRRTRGKDSDAAAAAG